MPLTRTAALLASGFIALSASLDAQRAPAPEPTRLEPDVLAMACAPALTFELPAVSLRLAGGQDSFARTSYSTSDLVTVSAGAKAGIEVGQEYFVRRLLTSRGGRITAQTPATIQTTGWIRIHAVDDDMSLATVSHACDTIEAGDYLEPIAHRAVPDPTEHRGAPERGNYGRVMTGTDRRSLFGKGDFFMLNRGEAAGVVPGARFVLYRDKKQAGNFLYEIGEATAVSVARDWSTLRVTVSRDAIQQGDYVGMRTKDESAR